MGGFIDKGHMLFYFPCFLFSSLHHLSIEAIFIFTLKATDNNNCGFYDTMLPCNAKQTDRIQRSSGYITRVQAMPDISFSPQSAIVRLGESGFGDNRPFNKMIFKQSDFIFLPFNVFRFLILLINFTGMGNFLMANSSSVYPQPNVTKMVHVVYV